MADNGLGGLLVEVGAVRGGVIRRHRLRISVHHDGFIAGLAEGIGGVDAAVVELDALADAVRPAAEDHHLGAGAGIGLALRWQWPIGSLMAVLVRSEEHTPELQSLMRISYAVICLKKTTNYNTKHYIKQ